MTPPPWSTPSRSSRTPRSSRASRSRTSILPASSTARKLGLDVRDDKEMGIFEITGPDKSHVLVYPKPDHQPAVFTVLNLQVRDIDEAVDALTSAGVKFERYDTADIKTDAKGVARGEKQGTEHRLVPRPVGQHRVRDGGRSVLTSRQAQIETPPVKRPAAFSCVASMCRQLQPLVLPQLRHL